MQTSRTSQTKLSFTQRLQTAFTGKVARWVAVSALAAGSLPLMQTAHIAQAAGNITGTVFQDFNSNGTRDTSGANGTAVDIGVVGVTVSAYDASGTLRGTTTSTASGAYTLTATGSGPYRIEFTALPTGFEPTAHGSSNATSVQFVADGTSSNINFAINIPCEHCQNDAKLAEALHKIDFSFFSGVAGSEPTTTTVAVVTSGADHLQPNNVPAFSGVSFQSNVTQTGGLWGIAWDRTRRSLYVASVFRRETDVGPSGIGGIYAVDPFAATQNGVPFITISNVGDPRPGGQPTIADTTAITAAGKAGLGGIDVSDDDSKLYVMNLNTRRLVQVDVASKTETTSYAVNNPGCANANDVRPWAVKVYRGEVYIGVTCSGETAGSLAGQSAYVMRLNGATFTTIASMPLTYAKDTVYDPANVCGNGWNAWSNTSDALACSSGAGKVRPEPLLSSIEVDSDGSLILGFLDRFMFKTAPQLFDAPRSGGDVRRLCNVSGAYVPEGGAGCAFKDADEYYTGDSYTAPNWYGNLNYTVHMEVSTGGLALIPGATDVAVSTFDPVNNDWDKGPNGRAAETSGVTWMSNSTGARTRAVFTSPEQVGSFGKGGSAGDMEYLCDPAPIEIGNRVWTDVNGNGIQDAGEAPLAGVIVSLQTPTTTLTTVTDANGNYYFSNLQANTAYTITVALGQAALNGGQLTQANANGLSSNTPITDVRDSDATWVNSVPTIYYTTGTAGQNNHSLDIGFYQPVNLGNYVWFDTNNNGSVDAGEQPVNGVAVQLYQDTNGDGVFSAGDTFISATTTNGVGLYNFIDLTPTSSSGTGYLVVLPSSNFQSGGALFNYQNSTSTVAGNSDLNNQDHGNVIGALGGAGVVASSVISLTAGGEPAVGVDGTDANGNQTIDFGFYSLASLGNYVWIDTNHDGVQNESNTGVNGVLVTLYDVNGTAISTTQTDATGFYGFSNLIPGTYSVGFTAPAGYTYTVQGNNPASDTDSNVGPNGRTAPVTLAPGENNPTLDAGLWLPAPAISLKKYVNSGGLLPPGDDAQTAPGISVLVGSAVTWTYVMTNTGNVDLVNVALTDDKIGAITCPKTTLAIGESMTCTANGTAIVGQYTNMGTVTAKDATNPNGPTLTANDPANYFGVAVVPLVASLGNYVWVDVNRDGQQGNPSVEPPLAGVTVTLYDGGGNAIATTTTNANGFYSFTNLAPGTYSVGFTMPPNYAVTQQGSNPASDTDSNVNPATGRTEPVTLVGGENNPTLDAGVFLQAPAISLKKYVNSGGLLPPGDDAQTAPGVLVAVGNTVTWTYVLKNIGNVDLVNVALTDDKEGAITCPKTTLAVNEEMTCTKTGIAKAGQYTNVGTVLAKDATNPNGPTLTATDPANYFAGAPQLVIRKRSIPVQSTGQTQAVVDIGDRITYTLQVTNTGGYTATNVRIADGVPAGTQFVAGSAVPAQSSGPDPLVWNVGNLAPGATASVSFAVTVVNRNPVAVQNTGAVSSNELVTATNSNTIVHVFKPTAVELINFSVSGQRVQWTTGAELDTFGFALYRSSTGNRSDATLVSLEMIAAKGDNTSYEFVDATAQANVSYSYWLMEVEKSGATVEYGPAKTEATTTVISSQLPVANSAVAAGGVAVQVDGATVGVVASAPNGMGNAALTQAVQTVSAETVNTNDKLTQPAVIAPAQQTTVIGNEAVAADTTAAHSAVAASEMTPQAKLPETTAPSTGKSASPNAATGVTGVEAKPVVRNAAVAAQPKAAQRSAAVTSTSTNVLAQTILLASVLAGVVALVGGLGLGVFMVARRKRS